MAKRRDLERAEEKGACKVISVWVSLKSSDVKCLLEIAVCM